MSKCEKKCKDCIHCDLCRNVHRLILFDENQTAHCKAFKDKSLFVELPCKVGDTVYMPWKWNGVKSIAYLTVTHIVFDRSKSYVKTDFNTDDEDYWSAYNCGEFDFADFGKTVFLTKEEAERKLREVGE